HNTWCTHGRCNMRHTGVVADQKWCALQHAGKHAQIRQSPTINGACPDSARNTGCQAALGQTTCHGNAPPFFHKLSAHLDETMSWPAAGGHACSRMHENSMPAVHVQTLRQRVSLAMVPVCQWKFQPDIFLDGQAQMPQQCD